MIFLWTFYMNIIAFVCKYMKFFSNEEIFCIKSIRYWMKSVAQRQEKHNITFWTCYFSRLQKIFPSKISVFRLKLVILRGIKTKNPETGFCIKNDSVFANVSNEISCITDSKFAYLGILCVFLHTKARGNNKSDFNELLL